MRSIDVDSLPRVLSPAKAAANADTNSTMRLEILPLPSHILRRFHAISEQIVANQCGAAAQQLGVLRLDP